MKFKKVLSGGILGGLILFSAGAAPAQAAGTAFSPISSFTWNFQGVDINVPTGCVLSLQTEGEGLRLDGGRSSVDCYGLPAIIPGLFCNWSGKYIFRDANGVEYANEQTAVQEGCAQAIFNIPGPSPRDMKTGQICVDFINNGDVRGTACMAVTP